MNKKPTIQVEDLRIHFTQRRQHPFAPLSFVHAVDGVSFKIYPGKALGIIGESGSGKTTTALGVLRLINSKSGKITLNNIDITSLKGKALRGIRRHMQIVFQDPYSSLNPRMRAGAIVREPLDRMNIGNFEERDRFVAELFNSVSLSSRQRALFPHQFSGGQRQRIGIARALASRPDLIVCDEPVSSLDVAIQSQILNLLRSIQQEYNLAYLFIAHDFSVVQYMCDQISVMYLGKIVESADRIQLAKNPLHPYTRALLSAIPSTNPEEKKTFYRMRLRGEPSSPIDPDPGCRFASRCPISEKICFSELPELIEAESGHWVACHRA